jgi:hypothetical protein
LPPLVTAPLSPRSLAALDLLPGGGAPPLATLDLLPGGGAPPLVAAPSPSSRSPSPSSARIFNDDGRAFPTLVVLQHTFPDRAIFFPEVLAVFSPEVIDVFASSPMTPG